MYICELKKQDQVVALKAKLSAAVEDTTATLKILNTMFQCDNIELFFHDESDSVLRDIVNGNVSDVKYLDKKSILGKTFLSQKSYIKNDVISDKRYNIAIDNPYKIEMTAQMLLCIVMNDKVQGIIRLSHTDEFSKLFVERIRLFVSSFKDIFLRFRPTHNIEIKEIIHTYIKSNGEEYRGGLYGFVSSHAANFFALSTYLYLVFKEQSRWWSLIFVWSIIIAYSRIYLGVHYPLDVIGGALLGISIGYLVDKVLTIFNPLNEKE